MQTALLLIALGFGYKIFAEATVSPKKQLKQLGRVVGAIIMLVSLLSAACGVYCLATGIYCPLGTSGFKHGHFGSKFFCPMMGKTQVTDAVEQKT